MALKNIYIPFAILFMNMVFSGGYLRMGDLSAVLIAYLLVRFDKSISKVILLTPKVVSLLESMLPQKLDFCTIYRVQSESGGVSLNSTGIV